MPKTGLIDHSETTAWLDHVTIFLDYDFYQSRRQGKDSDQPDFCKELLLEKSWMTNSKHHQEETQLKFPGEKLIKLS